MWWTVGLCGETWLTAVFSGRFDHSLDDKGRVSIPSRFREVLVREDCDRLFITNFSVDSDRCLDLYTPSEWARLVAKIKQRAAFDRDGRLFQTFYIGGAHELEVDAQGRILIPSRLRDFARLDREVTFSAMIDRFQLWDKAALARVLAAAEEQFKDPAFLGKLNL
jgi:MraZ protein